MQGGHLIWHFRSISLDRGPPRDQLPTPVPTHESTSVYKDHILELRKQIVDDKESTKTPDLLQFALLTVLLLSLRLNEVPNSKVEND